MSYISLELENNLEAITEKLKHNVRKQAFLRLVLQAIEEFKQTDYKNEEARKYFYNLVFETVFDIDEDNSYVTEYIAYFKSNVPFDLECFEIVVNHLMNGTIYFENAGETSLLDGDYIDDIMMQPSSNNKFPYLIRENSNEQIIIDKRVYTIGKDKNSVDYCIGKNEVISRRHAEIITKGNHYYICDKGSTNKTYVDNKEIPSEEVVEIFNGTKLKLANEKFTFYIHTVEE